MSQRYLLRVLILTCCFFMTGVNVSIADTLLGITWGGSYLVSFDPVAGSIVQYHTRLNPMEDFRGLAYDNNSNMLYALSQVSCNLYRINPVNLDVTKIGTLNTNGGDDIGGLTYNPINNTFYTTITHMDLNNNVVTSNLATVDVSTALITNIGTIANEFVYSISYDQQSGNLYGYASLLGSKADFVQINSQTAAMTDLFETPYDTIMGLASIPGESAFYSWVNGPSYAAYAEVTPGTGTVTLLGPSNTVGVSSDAMIYQNFYVAPEVPVPEPSTLLLLGLGLGWIGLVRRRAKK